MDPLGPVRRMLAESLGPYIDGDLLSNWKVGTGGLEIFNVRLRHEHINRLQKQAGSSLLLEGGSIGSIAVRPSSISSVDVVLSDVCLSLSFWGGDHLGSSLPKGAESGEVYRDDAVRDGSTAQTAGKRSGRLVRRLRGKRSVSREPRGRDSSEVTAQQMTKPAGVQLSEWIPPVVNDPTELMMPDDCESTAAPDDCESSSGSVVSLDTCVPEECRKPRQGGSVDERPLKPPVLHAKQTPWGRGDSCTFTHSNNSSTFGGKFAGDMQRGVEQLIGWASKVSSYKYKDEDWSCDVGGSGRQVSPPLLPHPLQALQPQPWRPGKPMKGARKSVPGTSRFPGPPRASLQVREPVTPRGSRKALFLGPPDQVWEATAAHKDAQSTDMQSELRGYDDNRLQLPDSSYVSGVVSGRRSKSPARSMSSPRRSVSRERGSNNSNQVKKEYWL